MSDGQKDLGGYCNADQVSDLISSCKDNHFIGVFNVQDTGGGNDANVLLHAADYWVGIKNAVIGQEKYCIVNIGNEWMGSPGRDCNGEWGDYQENLWSDTYIEAVRRIRSAGIKNTLMIDCNGYGQYADIIWKEGQRILDEDKKYFKDGKPNIIFSIHFYEKACYWDYEKEWVLVWHIPSTRRFPLVHQSALASMLILARVKNGRWTGKPFRTIPRL